MEAKRNVIIVDVEVNNRPGREMRVCWSGSVGAIELWCGRLRTRAGDAARSLWNGFRDARRAPSLFEFLSRFAARREASTVPDQHNRQRAPLLMPKKPRRQCYI
jgi:hypothetical protein